MIIKPEATLTIWMDLYFPWDFYLFTQTSWCVSFLNCAETWQASQQLCCWSQISSRHIYSSSVNFKAQCLSALESCSLIKWVTELTKLLESWCAMLICMLTGVELLVQLTNWLKVKLQSWSNRKAKKKRGWFAIFHMRFQLYARVTSGISG